MKPFLIRALVALLFSTVAWGQATVNENLETMVLYVSGSSIGDDSNPGTRALPLKTIMAAVLIAQTQNARGVGTHVFIDPGIYRESITMFAHYNHTNLPITFEATQPGTVFVSGAEHYKTWVAESGNPDIYTHYWPFRWGFCPADTGGAPLEPPIVLRQEMLFVNGVAMTQVLSAEQMLFPGTFFVDESTAQVSLWPPSGTDMSVADVEVSKQTDLLKVNGFNGVVFRGIVFEYASGCHRDTAVSIVGSAKNILFDSDSFVWNSGMGLSIDNPATSITVLNCVSNHNGATGYQAYRAKNVLWQNSEGSYNNWRGAQGAYYEWNTGGYHIFSDHDEAIVNGSAIYNQTFGIHWDTDVENESVTSFVASGNRSGILVEKIQGPLSITQSTFCSSRNGNSGEGGFVLRNSENVSLTSSTLYNNTSTQILLTGIAGGIATSNWETGQNYNLITQGITLTQNTVDALAGQLVFKGDALGTADWTSFLTSLNSNNNTWWNATDGSPFTVPVPKSGTSDTLTRWQSTFGQDMQSNFSAPGSSQTAACNVAADAPDWQFTVADGILPIDDTGTAVFSLSTLGLGGLTGTATLAVDGVSSIPGASASFPASISIPGAVPATFTAGIDTPPGTYTFTVLANSGDVTRTIALTVTVPSTPARVSTSSLAFPPQIIDTSSAPQTVTLSNAGNSALRVTSITPSYGFSQTNNCGNSLAAGASCVISVVFSPHGLNPYNGSLTIRDGDSTGYQKVTLRATVLGAPKVKLSVSHLYFEEVLFGNTKVLTSTLTNSGSAPMNLAISIPGSTDFTQTNNCGSVMAIGASCRISVTFSPTVIGQEAASLILSDNAITSPQTISLYGGGHTAVKTSPGSVGFGFLKVGSSRTLTVTFTNQSTATLNMQNIGISGSSAGDFSQTNTCGTTVAGGASCSIAITMTPQATGSREAILTILDSDPGSPQTINLTGVGK